MFSVCKAVSPNQKQTQLINKNAASTKSTRRKNRRKAKKRYFEHDTRVSVDEHAANVKNIKLNNKISIYNANNIRVGNSIAATSIHCAAGGPSKKLSKKSRAKLKQAQTTKQLQLQLIETQKQLQRQLKAMQQQQQQQTKSCLSFPCAKCQLHPNPIDPRMHTGICGQMHFPSHHFRHATDNSNNLINKKCTTAKSNSKSTDGNDTSIR